MRFIADSMLGRLARWLRLLGYDTLYYPEIEDSVLLRIARENNRILLTRDTHLVKVREFQQNIVESREKRVERVQIKYFLLKENNPFKQLKDVIKAFNLKDFSIMSRCAVCNALLKDISKEEVKNRVPQYVYQTSDAFKECPNCSKLYWKGTHPEKFIKKLSEILSN
jgi:uncharacterized protein with PIN domain